MYPGRKHWSDECFGPIALRFLWMVVSADRVHGWFDSEADAEEELRLLQRTEPDLPAWVSKWPAMLAYANPEAPWDEIAGDE